MTLPFPAGSYRIDRTHSTIGFSVRHMGISKVRGRFTGFDATVEVADTFEGCSLEASVELATVDTDNAMRDQHLRSTDFFGVEANPLMTFRCRAVSGEGGRAHLVGELTLNGTTRPLELDVEWLGTATFPGDGSTHVGFAASGRLSRRDFGIDFHVPLAAGGVVVGDRIDLDLDVQLIPAEQADAYHAQFVAAAG